MDGTGDSKPQPYHLRRERDHAVGVINEGSTASGVRLRPEIRGRVGAVTVVGEGSTHPVRTGRNRSKTPPGCRIEQMPDTTEIAAEGFSRGAKTYQQRARTALPILVRQAEARKTMFYGELAREMGIHPRTLNHPLGSMGRALLDLGRRWGRPVPPIQALVINKSSKRPGVGFAFFAPDAKDFDQATWLRLRDEVWDFPDWGQVLDAFELPRAVVELPPADEISAHGGGGEGAEHKRLKEAVSVNPLSACGESPG